MITRERGIEGGKAVAAFHPWRVRLGVHDEEIVFEFWCVGHGGRSERGPVDGAGFQLSSARASARAWSAEAVLK